MNNVYTCIPLVTTSARYIYKWLKQRLLHCDALKVYWYGFLDLCSYSDIVRHDLIQAMFVCACLC